MKHERISLMNTNFYRPRAMLARFAAAILAAGLMAIVGAKPAWAELDFSQAKNYTIGSRVVELTAADFDGDGNAADLAVATPDSTPADTLGNVAALSNEGDGTFAAARNVKAGISPRSVTSADFDGDGKEDLAVANGSSNVSISLSNGDDTFEAAKYYPVGSGAIQVTTGHFNDDGAVDFVDLAVASLGSDAVSVLLGNGDGTFRAAKNFEVGDAPVSVTSGDFNGDGKDDLATADDPYNPASGNIADDVSVLLGNGDGTFEDAWLFSFPTGPDNHANPRQIVSADFDGNGKDDLAVANSGGGDIGGTGCCNPGYVRVLLSDGDGTFTEGQQLGNAPLMSRPDSLTTADFDQDGTVDLATAQESPFRPGGVAVSLGNGDGTFNGVELFKPFEFDSYPTFVISEDLNDDNYPDLAVVIREASPERRLSVLLNIPPPGATTSTSEPSGVAGDPQPSFRLASSETDPSLAGSSAAGAGDTTRISVDPSGAQLNTSSSGSASISSDGRYVVFTSTSPDLVANDTNNRTDVFVRDRTTGTIRRVSVDSSGTQADGNSTNFFGTSGPSISSDGRFVAFTSVATNLVANDTNNAQDVFVRDRDADADGIFDEPGAVSTERVSVSSSGTQGNNIDIGTPWPSISADGRFVAFSSRASNLVPNDTNGTYDVFVRDRSTDTTQRVSVSGSGTQADRGGFGPSISANGRFVAFTSRAANLVSGDTNSAEDVFVRDRTTGTTQRVSVNSSGNQVSGACSGESACEGNSVVSISSSGRYVAYNSAAFNLVANDTNELNDIFVRDRDTDGDGVFDETEAAATERANVAGCASQANRGGYKPFISPDGRYVTFASQSTNLVANDANASPDVFVRDRTAKTTQRVSVTSSGTQSHLGGDGSSISADGRFAAFSSQSLDLVANDTNGFTDVFVRELGDTVTPPDDCIAPTTTASATVPNGTGASPYTSGSPTNRNVTVNLSAQDNQGGSGIKEIRYSATGVDAISEQTVTAANLPATFTIDAAGTTTISYFATDNDGNQEAPAKTLTVNIDRSAPKVSTVTPTGTGVTRGTNAIATFSERMDPTSISTSTFRLFRCSSTTSTDCANRITDVSVTPSNDRLRATLNPFPTSPTKLLARSTKYKVVVTTGAKDEAGNRLDQNTSADGNQQREWYFTTGSK